jgi:hypothetical protein
MSASHSDPLQGLRGLHLPPPVSVWPPAPGWWLLALLIILLAVVAVWGWRRYRKRAYRRLALKQLQQLRTVAQRGQASTVLAQLSILLRRVAISRYGREEVAALCGKDWLAFLDRTGRTRGFSEQAQALVDAPYQRNAPQQVEPLLDLAQHWVRVHS